jgi:hypothetical protein
LEGIHGGRAPLLMNIYFLMRMKSEREKEEHGRFVFAAQIVAIKNEEDTILWNMRK